MILDEGDVKLGRGLIRAQPNSDRCEVEERQLVGREIVISGLENRTQPIVMSSPGVSAR
jgi:hypothetical protein